MIDKEQINTLISVGTGLPPVNPYLDDSSQSEDDENRANTKRKPGRAPANAPKPAANKSSPDPKEYIAELERPEEEDLY